MNANTKGRAGADAQQPLIGVIRVARLNSLHTAIGALEAVLITDKRQRLKAREATGRRRNARGCYLGETRPGRGKV